MKYIGSLSRQTPTMLAERTMLEVGLYRKRRNFGVFLDHTGHLHIDKPPMALQPEFLGVVNKKSDPDMLADWIRDAQA